MIAEPLGLAVGERRKADALAVLEARRALYVLRGRRALLAALLEHGTATADDVREAVRIPPGCNPKLFGSVPGPLARAGIIRSVGNSKSHRAKAHARPLTVWQLRDPDAAREWLDANPDRPDTNPHTQPTFSIPTNAPTGGDTPVGASIERTI